MRSPVAPLILAFVAVCVVSVVPASAHPGSGIVVDRQGHVFVADVARGLLRIDTRGRVTRVHRESGHWLALDAAGRFSRMAFEKSEHWPRWFKRRTPTGATPALITDGGSPLVVHGNGNLYYVCNDERMIPGGLQIARLSPDGSLALLAPDLRQTAERLGGIKGLAIGPDGSLYATCPSAILKVKLDGAVSTLVHPIVLNDACDRHLPPNTPRAYEPFLTGLAVDPHGTVYAAATGCRRVVKITGDGRVQTVLKAERSWSPTGVAMHGGDLFVLEYTEPNGETHAWRPRVRKLGRDGKITTLVTISP